MQSVSPCHPNRASHILTSHEMFQHLATFLTPRVAKRSLRSATHPAVAPRIGVSQELRTHGDDPLPLPPAQNAAPPPLPQHHTTATGHRAVISIADGVLQRHSVIGVPAHCRQQRLLSVSQTPHDLTMHDGEFMVLYPRCIA